MPELPAGLRADVTGFTAGVMLGTAKGLLEAQSRAAAAAEAERVRRAEEAEAAKRAAADKIVAVAQALASHPFFTPAFPLLAAMAEAGHEMEVVRLFMDRLGSGALLPPAAAGERANALLAAGMSPMDAVLAIEAEHRPPPPPPPREPFRPLILKGGLAE